MYAVFTESPYKFWTYGSDAVMHVYDGRPDDSLLDAPMAFTPCDVEIACTWTRFIIDWMCCTSPGQTVLHWEHDEDDMRSVCISRSMVSDKQIVGLLYDLYDMDAVDIYDMDGNVTGDWEEYSVEDFTEDGRLIVW